MNCLRPVTSGSIPPPVIKGAKIVSALLVLASLGAIYAGLNGYLPFLAAKIGIGSGVVGMIAFGLLSIPAPGPARRRAPVGDSTALLVPFYTAGRKDIAGRTLEQILGKDDAWLEKQHDYIQWLFPTRNPSRHNPRAPLLNDENIPQLRGNENIRRAFVRMMQFYGLEWDGINVNRAKNWDERHKTWLNRGNHNYQRVTRIIKSLRALGFEAEAQAFWTQLRAIHDEFPIETEDAFTNHWVDAAN